MQEQKEKREMVYGWIDSALEEIGKNPEAFQSYLDAQARWLQYSARNVLLIERQAPQASRLGDYAYWRDYGFYVRRKERQRPILILEPGPEYVREDGSVGTYYNVRSVYDISQTTGKGKLMRRDMGQPDTRAKLRALMYPSPVPIQPEEKLGRPAYYNVTEQVIQVQKGLSGEEIFHALSVELAHMELEGMGYEEGERAVAAAYAAYIVEKRYGMAEAGDFPFLPQYFEGMDTKEIGAELKKIRDTAAAIAERVDRSLEHQQQKARPERQDR